MSVIHSRRGHCRRYCDKLVGLIRACMVSGRLLCIAGDGEPRLRLVEKVYCTTQGGGGSEVDILTEKLDQNCMSLVTLTLWRPLLPYGYSYKASRARPGKYIICNFWHPGTLTLSHERQSARMSKITNDCLTWSRTGCFIAVPIWRQGLKFNPGSGAIHPMTPKYRTPLPA